MLEGLGKVFGAEGKLANGPDLGILSLQHSLASLYSTALLYSSKNMVEVTYRLERLLVRFTEGAALEGDDRRGRLRVVGDRGPALGAEDAVDRLAGRAILRVALGRARDGQFVFGDNDYKRCCGVLVLKLFSASWIGGAIIEGTSVAVEVRK